MKEETKFTGNINWDKIRLLLKIGIVGAIIIFVGDLLMGWGIKDMSFPD